MVRFRWGQSIPHGPQEIFMNSLFRKHVKANIHMRDPNVGKEILSKRIFSTYIARL
jgi:hypothetical protein